MLPMMLIVEWHQFLLAKLKVKKLVEGSENKVPSGSTENVAQKGPGLEQVFLGLDCSVWVLDFVWKRFHNTSPGDFESMFIKAGANTGAAQWVGHCPAKWKVTDSITGQGT